MNEKLKELAEQATVNRGRMRVVDIEILTELIVKECADIINHRADTCHDWLDSIKANEAVREGQRECAKTIKEHFGVDE
jgi:hypothetical protein